MSTLDKSPKHDKSPKRTKSSESDKKYQCVHDKYKYT